MHSRLQILDGVVDRIRAGALIGAEREVPDEQLVGGPTSYRTGVVEHLRHGHGERVRVPEDVVSEGVADQEHRHLGFGEQPRGRVVVRGEHDEAPSLCFPRRQVPDGDRHDQATWTASSPASG